MNNEVPIWFRYSLSINEASMYYGIGIKKLYSIVKENRDANFILEIGTHIRIKRVAFELFLDECNAI